MFSPRFRSNPINLFFNSQNILSHFDSEKAHFPPIFAPTVSANPIMHVFLFIITPSDYAHFMRNFTALSVIPVYTSLIFQNRFTIKPCHNRASVVNLRFHFKNTLNFSILSDFNLGILVKSNTTSPF